MNKILLTITAVLISAACVLNAQTVTQSWATLASGANSYAIAIDASGNVYTANAGNSSASKISPDAVVTDPWVTLTTGAYPLGVVIDASGNVYTANAFNSTVSKITPEGLLTAAWATLPTDAYPWGIALDASGNVYTANTVNNTVSKITPEGAVTQSWATLAGNAGPIGIAIDVSGNVYTANYQNGTVSKITPGGAVTQSWATLAFGAEPYGVTLDATGNVYTANYNNNTISKITPDGSLTQAWATLASGAGPQGIALDASGNVYTANYNNNTVSKITADGMVTQAWATLATDANPVAIVIDAAGNVYTANYGNNTVSKISQVRKTVYVNASASGANDGTSWTNAFIYFQAGVNSAASGDSVFVAGGNYPLAAGYSYNMKEGVKIYGSFAGTESSLSQRNLAAGNISVLKGSDKTVIDNTSNNLTAAAVLDGFSITGGHADYGAGMYNYGSSPTIVGCSFWGNTAIGYGGGMENSSASPVLINCTFSGNSVTAGVGGGIYNYASSSIMTNCTFFGNTASGGGGGIYNSSSSPVLTNTIFWGNTAASGADILQSGGSFSINHSYTQTDFTASGGMGNITSGIDPFVNSSNPGGADGIYGTLDDGLHLNYTTGHFTVGSSPIDAGSNTAIPSEISTDIAGADRNQNSTVDMGAYEGVSSTRALPVTIMDFSGSLQKGIVILQWTSGVEAGFNHFVLQSSSNDKTYSAIATIAAKGSNNSYTYSTTQIEPTAYYRLRVINNDGSSKLSNVVALSQKGSSQVLLYPNPAHSYINIKVVTAASIHIFDALGRLVKSQALHAGVNSIDVHALSAGAYYGVVNGIKLNFVKK